MNKGGTKKQDSRPAESGAGTAGEVPVVPNSEPNDAPPSAKETHLRAKNAGLTRDVAALEDSRRAALNLMEDAILAKEALRLSEGKLSSFVSATSDVIYEMSADWRVMSFLEGKGFIATAEEPRDNWIDAYIPEDERERVWAAIDHAIETRSTFELEHRVIRSDGSIGWTFSRAVPLLDDQGEIVKWFGAASDVTAQKQAAEALSESEAKYRSLFETIDEGFCILDLIYDEAGEAVDWRYLEVNQAYARLSGMKDPTGKLASEVVPSVEEYWLANFVRVVRTGEPMRYENFNEDTGRWYQTYVSRVGGEGSSRFAIVFDDVTERKQHERQQEFLLQFSDSLRAEQGADAVANRALEMLIEHLQLDRCYIAVYRLADDHADFTHQTGNERVPPLPGEGIRLSDFPEAMRVTFDRTLVIDDVAETEGLSDTDRRNIDALGLRALMAATLRKGENNPHWVIVAVSASPRKWTRGEIALLEEATERTWAAMQRARAEEALRESETNLTLTTEAAQVGTWQWNLATNAVEWSPIARRLFGYDEKDEPFTHEQWARILHPEDFRRMKEGLPMWTAEGKEIDFEYRITHRHTNEVRWIRSIGSVGHDESGGPAVLRGITFDVTERKRAEEALRESEQKYRTLFDSIDEGYCLAEIFFDQAGVPSDLKVLDYNPVFERHAGMGDLRGKTARCVLPVFEDHWLKAFGRVVLTGQSERIEEHAAASNRYYSVHASRVGDEGSRTVVLVFDDVTRRRRREARLTFLAEVQDDLARLVSAREIIEAVGRRMQTYLNLSTCLFVEIDEAADRANVTEGWRDADLPEIEGTYSISRFLSEELVAALRGGTAVAADDTQTDPRVDASSYAALHIGSFAMTPFHRGGEWRFLVVVASSEARRWREDELELIREISERLFPRLERARAEQALRESEQRSRALTENLPGGAAFIVDRNLRYILAQGEAMKTAGMRPQDMLGRTIFEALPPDVAAGHEPHYRAALKGETFTHEHTSHGRTFITRGTPLRNSEGEIHSVLAVSYDITDRKVAEEALRKSEEELQIAHDELEARVEQRTRELAMTNHALSREIEERKSLENSRIELVHRIVTTQEEERQRIARDLHDQLGQKLTALRLKLAALRDDAVSEADITNSVEMAQELAEQLDAEVGFLAADLRPSALDDLGLREALKAYASEWSAHFGIPLHYHSNLNKNDRLPGESETHLYRIAQEALNNTAKYADAGEVVVTLEKSADGVIMVVGDDGVGFDGDRQTHHEPGRGLGLVGMSERADLIGANLLIESEPGGGTTIIVKTPPAEALKAAS